jgi:crotonobetainyl-CoA:carnitine CoA-transferase CaiB-like acyl-CoA transferase
MTQNPSTTNVDELPLSDITVVDLTQVIAGPFATMTLGDLGADVIKIEAVGRGDRSRDVRPRPEYFETVNRNKRSIALDLKSDRGQAVAGRIATEADVFIESTKPGRIERYGLDYGTLLNDNPSIIYCSITGFGTDSPYEEVPAWDMLVQAMSGIMSMTGTPETPPLWSGLPSGDLAAAMYATQSILAALYARETGQITTEWIEVPMLDAAISWLSARAGHTFGLDEPFPRYGTHHPSAAPFGVFECSDGQIVVAAGTDSLWESFCLAIDRTDLLEDDRFESIDDRTSNREALHAALKPEFEANPTHRLLETLHDYGVPAGPIYDTKTVWEDEHVKRRGLKRTMQRNGREATVIDHPVHFSNIMTDLRLAPPDVGADTDEILESVGFTSEEIADLRADEVLE